MPESDRPKSVFDMPAFTPVAPVEADRPLSVFTIQPEPAVESAEPKPAASRRRESSAAGQAAAATEEGSN